MIKLPKDVNEIIKTLNTNRFECYAVGGCVRDAILGLKPLDWDLATNAKLEDLQKIFPEAKVLSEEYSVIRLDFTKTEDDDKNPIVDIATFRSERDFKNYGKPSDVHFVDTIEEDLKRRDFRINAMADNPQKTFVDPYDGKKDINDRIIRVIGDPEVRFTEDPLRILRAIRFAAEKGFEIEENTLEAMKKTAKLLNEISIDKIRDEFIKIMGARFTGKGIEILIDTDAIKVIVGDAISKLMPKKRVMFNKLIRNIDSTYPVAVRRMGLFFSAIGERNGHESIEKLNFDKKTKTYLLDAIYNIDKLGIVKKDFELKDFMYEYGLSRYTYMDKLAQDKVVVYNGSARRINKRAELINRFEMMNEPIFAEDLVIDGNDLKEVGLKGEAIGAVIDALVTEIHRKPHRNNRQSLIEMANGYMKNPIKTKLRNNQWIKRLK